MKGPKRDTRKKAAGAAGRSAEAPVSPKSPRGGAAAARRAHNPKVAGSIPAPATSRPGRPHKLAPPPPVTDCAKCRKLAEAKADATRWHALATKLQGEIDARTKAALAGICVTLDDAAIAKVVQEVYHPCFAEVLAVSRDIALNPAAEDKDRLKAVGMIKDQVAGPPKQRHELTGANGAPLCTPTMLEVIVVGQAHFAKPPAAAPAPPPNEEPAG